MTQTQTAINPRWTAWICGLLLLVFSIISYSAALTKNATIDESTHAISGWLELRRGDFRVETVNPPLWKCWAALANLFASPPMDKPSVIWNNRTWDPDAEVLWSGQTLYQSPGFDGDAFIQRSRAMMLIAGILLGALIAYWSYRLAGPVAAITATTLFSFDPNFIAHAPLVKADVSFSLVLLLLTFAIWRLGQRASAGWIAATGVLCGVAINLKFSGGLVGPLLAIVLLIRALLPMRWMVLKRWVTTRIGRILCAVTISLFAAVCCFALTWACYGFRYLPTPSPQVQMDMSAIFAKAHLVETTEALGHLPTKSQLAHFPPGATSRWIDWANHRHLLPQAMLAGLLYQHTCVQMWPAFLDGQQYDTGRWYYFPLAMLYKTPVAELAAFAIAGCVLALMTRTFTRPHLWTVLCLVIPFLLFAAAAVSTHLNIGVRNVLPLYPFMQITSGCAAAMLWHRRPRPTAIFGSALALMLLCETLTAWPDYIAFFNFPTGGERGGLVHLSDSNLDWGQDLKSLAQWQRQHRELPLYAKLFDSVDPAFYGLDYHEITIPPSGPHAGQPTAAVPMTSGYLAVSATNLQGLYIKPWERWFYQRLARSRPIAVIGGTIYIYRF